MKEAAGYSWVVDNLESRWLIAPFTVGRPICADPGHYMPSGRFLYHRGTRLGPHILTTQLPPSVVGEAIGFRAPVSTCRRMSVARTPIEATPPAYRPTLTP
jgi:hypothetical protein